MRLQLLLSLLTTLWITLQHLNHGKFYNVSAFIISISITSTTSTTTVTPTPSLLLTAATTSSDGSTSTASDRLSTSPTPVTPKLGILYDTPVSNHGARCRLILYKKGIGPEEVLIQPPSVLGGVTSETYRSFNPEGKMPLFVCTDRQNDCNNDTTNMNDDLLHIFESDTIARFLLHQYEHIHPLFQPNNVRSNLMVRIHDMYISTIQGCLYKAKPPFGIYSTRIDALQELIRQLCIIEKFIGATKRQQQRPILFMWQ